MHIKIQQINIKVNIYSLAQGIIKSFTTADQLPTPNNSCCQCIENTFYFHRVLNLAHPNAFEAVVQHIADGLYGLHYYGIAVYVHPDSILVAVDKWL